MTDAKHTADGMRPGQLRAIQYLKKRYCTLEQRQIWLNGEIRKQLNRALPVASV